MADETEKSTRSWAGQISEDIKAIHAILLFLVFIAGGILWFVESRSSSQRAFGQAVAAETRYLSLTAEALVDGLEDMETNSNAADVQLAFACRRLRKDVSDFEDYPTGYAFLQQTGEQHQRAKARLDALKIVMISKIEQIHEAGHNQKGPLVEFDRCMEENEADSEAELDEVQRRSDSDSEQVTEDPPPVVEKEYTETKKEARSDIRELATTKAKLWAKEVTAISLPASLTLTAGKDDGFSVDIFWCESGTAQVSRKRFILAQEISNDVKVAADRFAARGNSGDLKIGRVRLRKLLLERQLEAAYPSEGVEIRHETNEKEIATELQKLVAKSAGTDIPLRQVENETPYYVSMFICF